MKVRPQKRVRRHQADHRVRVPADYHWQVLGLLRDALSSTVSPEFNQRLAKAIRLRDVPGYYSLGDDYGLQSINRDPGDGCVITHACQYLLSSVVRKYPDMELVSAKDRRNACIEGVKTLDAAIPTSSCYWFNDPVFDTMRLVIQEILGPTPSVEVIAESARHGPGSATTIGFEDRSRYFKYQAWPYPVAPRAKDLLIAVIQLDQRWIGVLEDDYRLRYGIPPWRLLNKETFWNNIVHAEHCWNRVTTVPKDGTKDRPIAIEPAGNIFLQLGIEGVIRSRLRAAGLNLDSQLRNRSWCLEFSKEDSGYTIDLSNASDTISRKFCEAMLPSGWFDLLDSVRSPYGEFPDGTYWIYSKMSSMGNATTFVLETLLFWALQIAVSRHFGHKKDRSVAFGDDLLGEGYLARHMFVYLPICGFSVNRKKSFVSGPVRESCGVDSYRGYDIRPVFLKDRPETELDILRDRNRLNRWFGIHFGTSNPIALDCFFAKYLGEWIEGPESDTEFDTYWHISGFPFTGFRSYTIASTERPVRGFGFRKLMHDLRGASEGGRFRISKEKVGKIRVVERSPQVGGYSLHGSACDQPKQPHGV